jgi:hypothetical protein
MLHSKQYAKFCESAIGEFLHHEPLDKSDRRLICFHMRVNNPKLKSLAIFNEVERGVPVN